MNEIFPPLVHSAAPSEDLRELHAVIDVGVPTNEKALNLGDVSSALSVSIVHPIHGSGVKFPEHVPGVQYHPGRRKWVALYQSAKPGKLPELSVHGAVLQKCQVDHPSRAIIKLKAYPSESAPGLWLRFDPKQIEFIDIHDIFCPELLTLEMAGADPDLAVATVAPIRADYWDLVDPSGLRSNPNLERHRGALSVQLYGGLEVVADYSAAKTHSLGECLFEFWPHVPYDFWKVTWVSCLSEQTLPENSQATPLIDQAYDSPGHSDKKSWCFAPAPTESGTHPTIDFDKGKDTPRRVLCTDRVRAIGVRSGRAEGVFLSASDVGDSEAFKSLPTAELPAAPANADSGTVSIDFGTSRSCVVLQTQKDALGMPRDFGCHARYSTDSSKKSWVNIIAPHAAARHFKDRPSDFELGGEVSHEEFESSHLICETRLLWRKGANRQNPEPFIDFAVRPKFVELQQLMGGYEGLDRPTQSLKWGDNNAERVQFLTCLLLIATAESAAVIGSKELEVCFSYPLAFDPAQIKGLSDGFQEAIDRVQELTGVTCRLGPSVSESMAGIKALAAAGGDWVLTIDVGGGTTDFALWKDVQKGGALPEVLGADSVEYAGDLLLTAAKTLTGGSIDRAKDAIMQQSVNPAKSEMGFLGKYLTKAKKTAQNDYQKYIDTLQTWQLWLVEYTARLIAGAIISQAQSSESVGSDLSIRIVLLGGAWNALDATTHEQTPRSFAQEKEAHDWLRDKIQERVKELIGEQPAVAKIKLTFPDLGTGILKAGREKVAIAQGIAAAGKDDIKPGILSANGFVEQTKDGRIEWYAMAGTSRQADSRFALNSDLVPEPAIPGAEKIRALLELADPNSETSQNMRETLNRITEVSDKGGRRSRTALSAIYKTVLAQEIGGDDV